MNSGHSEDWEDCDEFESLGEDSDISGSSSVVLESDNDGVDLFVENHVLVSVGELKAGTTHSFLGRGLLALLGGGCLLLRVLSDFGLALARGAAMSGTPYASEMRIWSCCRDICGRTDARAFLVCLPPTSLIL
jgi:hypothetical protein